MATVFSLFKEISFTYLEIEQSTVRGDTVKSETELTGVFKGKAGLNQSGDIEILESSATLHVHPEDFDVKNVAELIGHGVNVNGQDYTIAGATAGTNFDKGVNEHYTLTLKATTFVRPDIPTNWKVHEIEEGT